MSEEELENAKNNLLGKWAFITETNSQQATWMGQFDIIGVGYDYLERAEELIKKVTPQEIKDCANKYFNDNYVLSILKP